MKKGHRAIPRVALATGGVLVLIVLLRLLFLNEEPRVGGKSVEEWIQRAEAPWMGQNGKAVSEEEMRRAVEVLHELGTKAEPALIRYLKAQDTKWDKLYERLYQYQKAPTALKGHLKRPIPAWARRQMAVLAIGESGQVSPAIEAALYEVMQERAVGLSAQ